MKYQSSIQGIRDLHKQYIDKSLSLSYNIRSEVTKDKLWIENIEMRCRK